MAQTPTCFTAEQRNALIDAFEAAFAQQGVTLYEGARWLTALLDAHYPRIVAAHSRETLDAEMASWNEEDVGQIHVYIALLSALPGLINAYLGEAARAKAEELPLPAGPPTKTTPEMRRQIINCVSELHAKGAAIGHAQLRTSQRFDLSKRTVQRIWQQRSQLADQPFQTLSDAWNFLQS